MRLDPRVHGTDKRMNMRITGATFIDHSFNASDSICWEKCIQNPNCQYATTEAAGALRLCRLYDTKPVFTFDPNIDDTKRDFRYVDNICRPRSAPTTD